MTAACNLEYNSRLDEVPEGFWLLSVTEPHSAVGMFYCNRP